MTMGRVLLCLAVLLGSTGLAAAQNQSTSKRLLDPIKQCGVFVLPALALSHPHIRWQGLCSSEGLAEGEGIVTFATSANGKTEKVWEGNFRNGFFTGRSRAIEIKPLGERRALVRLPGGYGDSAAWLISRLPADGPLPVCGDNVGHVAVETTVREEAMHAMPLRQLMQKAAIAYRAVCPQPLRLRLAVIPRGRFGDLDNGVFDDAKTVVARASLAEDDPVEALHNFQLVALDAVIINRRQRERDAAWHRWREFSRSNWVVHWVTARQLNEKPSRYQGKIVALAGAFVRQIAPDTALVRDIFGNEVMVQGLPETLSKSGVDVVIAGTSQRRKLPPLSFGALVVVEATSWRACERNGCRDYLDWMESQPTPFPWGEDQSRY